MVDQAPGWLAAVDSATDQTYTISDTPSVSLAEFLSRPVNIHTHSWAVEAAGSPKYEKLNPWTLFFKDTTIKEKLATFSLLRCKLKVKFVVNGSGFLYGCKVAWYHPMQPLSELNSGPIELGVSTGTMDIGQFVIESQKPKVFLLPQVSQGGTLECPFIWPANYVSIPDSEFDNLGVIYICTLNPLTIALTNQSTSADIAVFAWAEDVELAVPTSQSQAGDEYATGPVSTVAAAVANVASAWVANPIIGAYARATQMAATAVGNLASLFGYSKPATITDIIPYKPSYFGSLAYTSGGDPVSKLTFDPKQEVTIDPRVVGMKPEDEMTITSIASRESYIATFLWQYTSTNLTINKMNDRLFQFVVSPYLHRSRADTTTPSAKPGIKPLYLTGSAFVALPFKYWHGTMKYRFQIIASQFHRGRLRIVWDPVKIKETEGSTNGQKNLFKDYPKVYSAIIDIATTRDFTLTVGWGQATPFLINTIVPGQTTYGEMFSPGSFTSAVGTLASIGNGVIGVYVLNPLISPHDSTSVYINVYSSCEDLQVAGPLSQRISRYSYSNPHGLPDASSQAGFEEYGLQLDGAPVAPTGATNIHFGPQPKNAHLLDQIFFGDPIKSIRALVKRYTFHYSLVPQSHKIGTSTLYDPLPSWCRWTLPDFPMYYGIFTDGYLKVNATEPSVHLDFNWCFVSFLNFFTPAFVCRRGGIRWKYNYRGQKFNNDTNYSYAESGPLLKVMRGTDSHIRQYTQTESGDISEPTFMLKGDMDNMHDGLGGMATQMSGFNPVVEVELPYYSQRRFRLGTKAKQGDLTPLNFAQYQARDYSFHTVELQRSVAYKVGDPIQAYVAAADDFSLSLYIGPPVIYDTTDKVITPKADSLFFTLST